MTIQNTNVQTETLDKYFSALTELYTVLSYTNRVSLNEFSEKKQLSKNLSKVLQKGGVILCLKKGRFSEWKWNTIPPTKQMALKAIQTLGDFNPPRKRQVKKEIILEVKKPIRGGYRKGAGRKTKEVELQNIKEEKSINVKLFFGLISFNINL